MAPLRSFWCVRAAWIRDERLAEFLSSDRRRIVDMTGFLDKIREWVLEGAEAAVERAAAAGGPAEHKRQQIESARARGSHWRLRRLRRRLVGTSAVDGTVAWTPLQAGAMVEANWAPVFAERHVDAMSAPDN